MRKQSELADSVSKGIKEHERNETSFGCLAIAILFLVFPVAWIASSSVTEGIASGFVIAGLITIVAMLLLRALYR